MPIMEQVQFLGNDKEITSSFVIIPETGTKLLRRDFQVQLGIGVIPEEGRMLVKLFKLTTEDEREINSVVWVAKYHREGLSIAPLEIKLKERSQPDHVKQYPRSLEGGRGLQVIIEQLLKDGLLEPCTSPCNTPILPVGKPDGTYRFVQDFRELNKLVQVHYLAVPNPYTLLCKILHNHVWFSVIDLKDAFWTCPLAVNS